MILVMIEAERAEGSVDAVQAKHVALALVCGGVDLALPEEGCLQQRPEPPGPLLIQIQ